MEQELRCKGGKNSGLKAIGHQLGAWGFHRVGLSGKRASAYRRNSALNFRYVERLLKFLLWQRVGYRVRIAGDSEIAQQIRAIYSPGGERAFDHEFMGSKVYGRPMDVEICEWEDLPEPRELSIPLVAEPSLDIVEYVPGFIRRFEADVRNKLTKRLG